MVHLQEAWVRRFETVDGRSDRPIVVVSPWIEIVARDEDREQEKNEGSGQHKQEIQIKVKNAGFEGKKRGAGRRSGGRGHRPISTGS